MSAIEERKWHGGVRKWHSPFCFRKVKLDVVLCVKASKFMHTHEHTHSFSSTEGFSVLSGTDERRSAEMWRLLSVSFYSVIPYMSREDDKSENSLKQAQWEQQVPIQEKKKKTYGLSSICYGKDGGLFSASGVNIGTNLCSCSLAPSGLKHNVGVLQQMSTFLAFILQGCCWKYQDRRGHIIYI